MTGSPFSKVLVANRGEIACRIIQAARSLGFASVAVASEADRHARHTLFADEAVLLGGAAVGESYLDPVKLIEAARLTGADAIHPGYGFLSERAEFAAACATAGIVFIGPSPSAIRAMGDKAESKRRMLAAGVPCVPGYEGTNQSDERLLVEAERIGLPLMIKASAGGGGRGMRLVTETDQLEAALRSARSEALKAFGNDTLLLERAVVDARHVEVQVFGDHYGTVLHLGERDCSVQRRHQKVIEEAPSPAVDKDLRARIGEAAVRAALAIDYVGAGTVEFLLSSDGQFYFLEMNTRLQVEHPVTEGVTGLDLVALQFQVAAGLPLGITQEDVKLTGHAIEARLYAEDPSQDYLPQTGRMELWQAPSGEGIRTDHGLGAVTDISPYYDSMIAKVIATGADREQARRRLVHALRETVALGVKTNKPFLISILESEAFKSGIATTNFLNTAFPASARLETPAAMEYVALAAVLACRGRDQRWTSNSWLGALVVLKSEATRYDLRIRRLDGAWTVQTPQGELKLQLEAVDENSVSWWQDNRLRHARYLRRDREIHLDVGESVFRLYDETLLPPETAAPAPGEMRAPMNGVVSFLSVAPGDEVRQGQTLLVIEAMKMEHSILAAADGVVETVSTEIGALVSAKQVLVTLRDVEA